MIQGRVLSWNVLQAGLFAAAWLCCFWLVTLVSWYDTKMPRVPDPMHGRTVPVVITGGSPLYLTAHESRTWHFTQYASGSTMILFFAVLAWRTNVKPPATRS